MTAAEHLNNIQFPHPNERRDIGGVEHEFAGYHTTHRADFTIDQTHEHRENYGSGTRDKYKGADHGDVYTTYDPESWGRSGRATHAAEIWRPVKAGERGPSPIAHDESNEHSGHEDIISKHEAHLGPVHPLAAAVAAAAPYAHENGKLASLAYGPNVARQAYHRGKSKWVDVKVRAVK